MTRTSIIFIYFFVEQVKIKTTTSQNLLLIMNAWLAIA